MASTELLLSLSCILVTGLSKLPQIYSLHRASDVGGFSSASLHLMLISNCLQTGFYMCESYPLLIYLEYPLLILQELILLYLVGRLSSSLTSTTIYITAYIALIFSVGCGFFPKAAVLAVLSINIPLGLSSKVAQVGDIRAASTSQGVSSLPFLINACTRVARLHTTLNSGVALEPLLLANSIIQLSANVCVLAVIQLFKQKKLKDL